ncbi:oxidoreductase [Enterobacter cancerogenus]|uniref:Oxidoreductase n=1 Tax=Enterobacter cancerogenus TaxID=69218 RepID=A0AB38P2Y4_9ENTR|nr:SDR family oxidoreductase [Enterobacter cancerogenus]TKK17855.1 oxidoreductase [Enterobacter cancerogenus]
MKRLALVTGVSSGIGAAIADDLLARGWRVTGLSRTAVCKGSPDFTPVSVDLLDAGAVQLAVDALPQVDAIIHAAGVMGVATLGELDPMLSERMWRLHIHAAEIIVNALAPRLPQYGRIVLIGSRTANGAAGRSQYVATKSAMYGMVRSWAAELIGRGITANIVAPGATDTPMLKIPGREISPPKLPPMGRFIQPGEVAATINFLLSAEASAITGQELVICGGSSL